MNVALWIAQVLLALLYLWAGGLKLVLPLNKLEGPVPLPGPFLRFIGVAEVLGALGRMLPSLLRHPAGPHPAGRRRAGHHHDRRDGAHPSGQ